MDSRKLNRKVVIKHFVDGQDEIGQPSQVPATLATVYADIRFPRGLETIKAGAQTSIAGASVSIRRRVDVTPAMWLEFEGKKLQITAVLPDERGREYMDLTCEVIS